jgi:poly-beta-1,6-N-acetyl-D-glucosamine synthase
VIICARNEAWNIGLCLKTLLLQDYPKDLIELILVDDQSSDRTLQEAENYLTESGITYRIISNDVRKGKKRSITAAMKLASHQLIVLRDADTYTRSKNWLRSISEYYTWSGNDLIIAPVSISDNKGLLWALQAIENNVLTVLAAGSSWYQRPFLCNGANLIFTKAIFEKAGGYATHLHLYSGDDIFFLEDVKKIPGAKIGYLKCKDTIVETYPARTLKKLWDQRTRWASKFKHNSNKLNFLIAFLTLAVNGLWIGALICSVLVFNINCILFVFLKAAIDILLLFLSEQFIENKGIRKYILPMVIVYPFYAFIIAFCSLIRKTGNKTHGVDL